MILYNLFPLLAGSFTQWEPHLQRAAGNEFLQNRPAHFHRSELVVRRRQHMNQRDSPRERLLQRLGPVGVKAAQRFRRRDAARELQLLVVDHLPLHRHRQQHTQRRGERNRLGSVQKMNTSAAGNSNAIMR